MKSLLGAGARVQSAFERHGWRFCFIGGVANYRWGTPRLTNDLDLTLLTGFGAERAFVDALLAEFPSRIPEPEAFAAANRVVLLRTEDGFGIDVALGAMPFEERTIARASRATLAPGAELLTCSAEDLIVHKGFAARMQDWADIEGVVVRQRGALAWPQIWEELAVLVALKEEPENLDTLRRIVERARGVVGPFEA